MTDLKPCPFCGGEAEMDTWRQYRALVSGNLGCACAVYCLTCEADMSICLEDVPGWTIEEAASHVADRWNTRANDSASFEAGERSRIERAANEAERFKAFADKKFDDALDNARRGQRNLDLAMAAAVGMAHQARQIAAVIRTLPTGETDE